MANKYEIKQLIKNESGQDELKIIHPKTDADIVTYDDTTTQLGVDNVQAAIEDLAGKVGSVSGDVSTELGNLGERIATLEGEMDAQQEVVQIGTHNDITLGVSSKPLTLTGFGSSPSYYSNDNKTYTLATTEKVNSIIDEKLAANDAMLFKGTIGSTTDGGTIQNLPTSKFDAGWTYKVVTKGTYSGFSVEVGDMFIAIKDYPGSGDIDPDDYWTVLQTNIDGAVISVATEAVGKIPVFNNATGTVLTKSNYAPTDFQLKVTALGSTTEPVYVSAAGTFAAASTYAGGTKVTLNGTDKGASTATIYAPTAKPTSGSNKYTVRYGTDGSVGWVPENQLDVATATKATQDASGNVITSTYATKAEMATAKNIAASLSSAKVVNADGTLDAKYDGDGNEISKTYLKLSGGIMTGDIIFDKNKAKGIRVASYNTSGEEQLNQVILTSDTTQTIVGNKQQDNVKLLGSDAPVWNDGTSEHTILTSKGGTINGNLSVGGNLSMSGGGKITGTKAVIDEISVVNKLNLSNTRKIVHDTDLYEYTFPEKSGTVALLSDLGEMTDENVKQTPFATSDAGQYPVLFTSSMGLNKETTATTKFTSGIFYSSSDKAIKSEGGFYTKVNTSYLLNLHEGHVTDGTIANSMFEIAESSSAQPSNTLSYGGLFFVPIG